MTRNQERAERAYQTLVHFNNLQSEGGEAPPLPRPGEGSTDLYDTITDLLANLIHLTDPEGVDEALGRAVGHYDVEAECPGCNGMIGDLEELCDTCQTDARCVRGGKSR